MMKCAFEVIVAGVIMMFQGHPTGQSKNGIKIMLRAMFWHGHGQFPDIVLSGCDASTVSLKTHLTPLALDLHFEIQEYHCIWLFFLFCWEPRLYFNSCQCAELPTELAAD